MRLPGIPLAIFRVGFVADFGRFGRADHIESHLEYMVILLILYIVQTRIIASLIASHPCRRNSCRWHPSRA